MTGIYVAFRRTAPVGAAWWQRALCALAMGLPVAGRITPELLLAAYAKHAATTTKGEHHARQN